MADAFDLADGYLNKRAPLRLPCFLARYPRPQSLRDDRLDLEQTQAVSVSQLADEVGYSSSFGP